MKRKKLPLSLALIIIVLGGVMLSFTTKDGSTSNHNLLENNNMMVVDNPPSVGYLSSIRNNQVSGLISNEHLNVAQTQLNELNISRSFNEMVWSQLGPNNFGGRTRAIIFDNKDQSSKTIYAAGVTGGIWKSLDLGISWHNALVSSFNLNVSCMNQDANGVIYVGTGESFGTETVSSLGEMGYTGGFMGQGLFVSVDGENFSLIESTLPQFNDDNADWAYINEIAIDMNNNRLYVATNAGLKISNDGGTTWSVAKDTAGADLNMNAVDVQVATDGSVVTCIDNKCYISTTAGFENRSTGDSISLPDSDVSRIKFAYAPSDPNILYATVIKEDGDLYNIYKSSDKGVSWRIIHPHSAAMPIFDGQGVYDNTLLVFPEDPNKILVGGIDAWEFYMVQETGLYASRSVSSSDYPIFLSGFLPANHHTYVFRPGTSNTFFIGTDGGVAIGSIIDGTYVFESSNRSYFTTQFYSVGPSGSENYVLGGAQGNGSILITGEGSSPKEGEKIYRGDGTDCAVSVINKEILVVSNPGLAPGSGVAADIQRSEDAGVNYSGQFASFLDIDTDAFITPIALWESFDNEYSRDSVWFYAKTEILGGSTVQVISNNSGQPFDYVTPSDINLFAGDSLLVKDIVSSMLFLASEDIVYMTRDLHSFDKRPDWFKISNSDFGFVANPQCLAYSSDANHLFVGSVEGKLFRISNLALAYDSIHADVNSAECIVSTKEIELLIPGTSDPITQVITSIAVDPQNPANVMITLGNYGNDTYVLYSTNALDEFPTFSSRQGNLPQMPIYSSIIEMSDSNLGIIGSEHGIFVTEDINSDSPTWLRQDSVMGSVPVFQLQQQLVSKTADTIFLVNGNEIKHDIYPGTNNYGVIYAATYGRGLFRTNAYRKPVGIEEIPNNGTTKYYDLNVYPNPVSNFATVQIDANNNSVTEISVFDLMGRKVLGKVVNVNEGSNSIMINLSNLNSGTYVIQAVVDSYIYTNKIVVN